MGPLQMGGVLCHDGFTLTQCYKFQDQGFFLIAFLLYFIAIFNCEQFNLVADCITFRLFSIYSLVLFPSCYIYKEDNYLYLKRLPLKKRLLLDTVRT